MKSRILALLALAITATVPQAIAKHWTVTERQNALKFEINRGEKRGDLTFKEAQALRKERAGILAKEAKMKEANNGKISVVDRNRLESNLNKLSDRTQKMQLAKRVK